MKIEKMDDPAMQQTMKVAKINPNGKASSVKDCIAGVHMKTKMYIDPSKREQIKPVNKISLE